MFGSCAHGFIASTCPHCRGSEPMDLEDMPGSVNVDMGRIMDAAVTRLENTGLRQNRAEASQIRRGFR